MVITLLGAESTGKSDLSQALARHLQSQGIQAMAIPEYLREWCAAQGRTPQPHEQAHIAATQTQRITAAAHTHRVVIADTTALMTAVYSEYVFGDLSLYPNALAQQRQYAVTLLSGLDMPWVADGIQREGDYVRAPVDALLRHRLDEAGIGYQVVYGLGAQRLHNAIDCIAACATIYWPIASKHSENTTKNTATWKWVCDKCSDADCEHRLFRQLTAPLSERVAGPAAV
jgi:nicotinamide riboside kinase